MRRGIDYSELTKYLSLIMFLRDITNGEIVSVVWRSRCPLKRTCKIKIGIDKILNALHDIGSCSGDAHEFEYEHVYEDKKCKVTARCNVLRDPRYDPLPNIVRKVAQDAGKVESLRGRLGISVTYLEGVLSVGYLVKEVRRFKHQVRSIPKRLLDPPCYWCLDQFAIWCNQGV